MAPNNNNNNNNNNNPFEQLFRSFFGSDDDDNGETSSSSDDIFANFPERANLPYGNDNNTTNRVGGGQFPERFPDWMKTMMIPHHHHPSDFQWSASSSYHMHRDQKEVSIDIDIPGVAAKDLKVEVLQDAANHSCTVQWSGERENNRGDNDDVAEDNNMNHQIRRQQLNVPPHMFSNRIRLGRNVDCDRLSAHLSRGVLHLKAPVKPPQEDVRTTRSIPITED